PRTSLLPILCLKTLAKELSPAIFVTALSVLFISHMAWSSPSCPAFVPATEIFERGHAIVGAHVQAFRWSVAEKTWRNIPMALDPLDSEGYVLFPDKKSIAAMTLNPQDRFSIDPGAFGDVMPESAAWPCAAESGFDVSIPGAITRHAYLFVC